MFFAGSEGPVYKKSVDSENNSCMCGRFKMINVEVIYIHITLALSLSSIHFVWPKTASKPFRCFFNETVDG